MFGPGNVVATVGQPVAAIKDAGSHLIVVYGDLAGALSIRLSPGHSLRGEGEGVAISFAKGSDGLQLPSDNRGHNIRLGTDPDKRAIFNDTTVTTLRRIELHSVTTIGWFSFSRATLRCVASSRLAARCSA